MESMKPLDPSNIRVIVATDCGSTTTKAILIECIDGHYHQTHRGEAPTTVEEPVADVTIGVVNALTELQELAGRRLIDDQGKIIRPAVGKDGYLPVQQGIVAALPYCSDFVAGHSLRTFDDLAEVVTRG